MHVARRLRVLGALLAMALIAGLVLLAVHPELDPARLPPLALVAAAWAAFAAGAWLVRGIPLRSAIAAIMIGGLAIQIAALSAPPVQSDDLYRYIWDGRVQAAGIDPYRYVPAAPQLSGLREPFLWSAYGDHRYRHCIRPGTPDPVAPGVTLAAGCTRINRPTVPTIYPPVAEAYFLAVHYLAPAGSGSGPIQAAAAICAVLCTVLLLFGLRSAGQDPRRAVLWAWCPAAGLEAGNNAHVEALTVILTASAMLVLGKAAGRRSSLAGGALLGLAIATRITPVLAGPAVLRRRWLAICSAAASALVVVYLPHILMVGPGVLGYLPRYLVAEGYGSGSRFGLIGVFVPGTAATVVAAAVMAIATLAVLRFTDPDRPWRGAMVLTATALAVTTPAYPWYALLLVTLVALDGRAEWLAFAAAAYYAGSPALGPFSETRLGAERLGYGAAVLFVIAVSEARYIRARRSRPPAAAAPAATLPGRAPAVGRTPA